VRDVHYVQIACEDGVSRDIAKMASIANTIAETPEASPSKPSVIFTPFDTAVIINITINTYSVHA